MTPHRPTPDTTPNPAPGWSLPAFVPVAGLLLWGDVEDCDACAWACDPATRAVLGDRWGGACPYHLGHDDGAERAGEWWPDEYPGPLGCYRLARRLAAVLLAFSRADYSRAVRRARALAVWGEQ